MVNNSLGVLSNAHVVHADASPLMALDPKCLRLARLCSIAVDFPKIGVVAVLPSNLRPKEYPDFMEKPDKPEYRLERVLGKLFREVIEAGRSTDKETLSFMKRDAKKWYDKELEVAGFTRYLKEAVDLKQHYDDKLLYLMYQYDAKSEAEMSTGNIFGLSKWVLKRSSGMKERMLTAMGALKKETRSWLKDENVYRSNSDEEEPLPLYSATYLPAPLPTSARTQHINSSLIASCLCLCDSSFVKLQSELLLTSSAAKGKVALSGSFAISAKLTFLLGVAKIIYSIHDEAKDKEFELEMRWI